MLPSWRGASASFAPDGWYRTGDYGFLDGGDVHVCGRADDYLVATGAACSVRRSSRP